MEKAAEAMKAAGLEVKVIHDDGRATYRVGDVTIVADAPMKTVTTNGERVVTGRLRDVRSSSKRSARDAVAYQAARGATPERLAQPAVAARRSGTGSVTDSADDTVRLYLVEKYVTDETAGIYVNPANPITVLDMSDTTPYGTDSRIVQFLHKHMDQSILTTHSPFVLEQ